MNRQLTVSRKRREQAAVSLADEERHLSSPSMSARSTIANTRRKDAATSQLSSYF